jgi:transcriptional regulator with XRE-family HTH domain
MADTATTFGAYIVEARKALKMNQKELAARIKREEDGSPISPQYLNDIEHDKRTPSSDHLIQQFAKVLSLNPDYLHYLAGQWSEELRRKKLTDKEFEKAFVAFRRTGGK